MVCGTLLKLGFILPSLLSALVLSIGYLPTATLFQNFPIEPVAYDSPVLEPDAALLDDLLDEKAEFLVKNQLVGPESLAVRNGLIYAGLADGRLVEIDPVRQHVREITNFARDGAKGCGPGKVHNSPDCGRPLGTRFDSKGNLYVVDAYSGLFRVDIKSGKKTWIALGTGSPKHLSGFNNNIAIDRTDENIIYVFISSRKWTMDTFTWSLTEYDTTGAVVAVDIKTAKSLVIAEGFAFTNGGDISPDNKWLLIPESWACRINRINLEEVRKALKSGDTSTIKKEIFISTHNEIDSIRFSQTGDLYVPFPFFRLNGAFEFDKLSRYPTARKIAARLSYLLGVSLEFASMFYDHHVVKELAHAFKSGVIFLKSLPETTAIGVYDGKTGALKGYFGSKKFSGATEATFDSKTGDLYIGSLTNPFLLKVKAKDLKF